MKYKYIYYKTDDSFDYGDFTHHEITEHCFEIDIDYQNQININTLIGYGDFTNIEQKIKTARDFYNFLKENMDKVEEIEQDTAFSNVELFEELLEFTQKQSIKEQIKACCDYLMSIMNDNDNLFFIKNKECDCITKAYTILRGI